MKNILSVPARALVSRSSPFIEIAMDTRQTFSDDLKKAIRKICQNHPNYNIAVDNGGVFGESNGQSIPINNLGKWLFGTPGYKGHIIMSPENPEALRVYYPAITPKQAVEMLQSLTADNIQAACQYWGDERYKPE
ncbi:MAG TPA: hypothetical protein PLW94_02395 [Candidatus Absconditabacterales bacterium]|nr:hypothetical protein [Candidatus Absconditabacterales bacterium]